MKQDLRNDRGEALQVLLLDIGLHASGSEASVLGYALNLGPFWGLKLLFYEENPDKSLVFGGTL